MTDSDLAVIYGVTTKRLNEQVKRNLGRFPEDFMFQLSKDEIDQVSSSRSQFATLKRGLNIKYAPYVFTEHGAVMLASILNSPVAVEASIQVVRAFIRMRSILSAHKELAKKLQELEKKQNNQTIKSDSQFKSLLDLIKKVLHEQSTKPKTKIGFKTEGN